MDVNTLGQTRQDVEKDAIHVAIDLAYVSGIDEENIVSPERFEFGSVNVLKAAGFDVYALLVRFF